GRGPEPAGEDVLLDPLHDRTRELALRDRWTGAEDDRVALLGRIAAQIGDAWQDLQVVDAARLPSLGRLHVDRGAVPRDLVGSPRRRQQDLRREPGRGAAGAARGPPAAPLVGDVVALDPGAA